MRISNGQIKQPLKQESFSDDETSESTLSDCDTDPAVLEKLCEICGEVVETDDFQLPGDRFYCSIECYEVDEKDHREGNGQESDIVLLPQVRKINYISSQLPIITLK